MQHQWVEIQHQWVAIHPPQTLRNDMPSRLAWLNISVVSDHLCAIRASNRLNQSFTSKEDGDDDHVNNTLRAISSLEGCLKNLMSLTLPSELKVYMNILKHLLAEVSLSSSLVKTPSFGCACRSKQV